MGNPIVQFEIGCKDSAAISSFYENTFGGKIRKPPMGSDMDTCADRGISDAIRALSHEPHQYVKFFMQVENADDAAAKIKANGGKDTINARDISGGKGRFARFKDPEGSGLAIYQPPEK